MNNRNTTKMKVLQRKLTFTLLLLVVVAGLAWAIPGYKINDDASAGRAVRQSAGDSDRFGAVVYQALLDKNSWRLALVAHDYLQQKPGDPQRECSFAQAYWQSQQVGVSEQVPEAAKTHLRGLFEEAARDTEDAARRLPNTAAAHLTYGRYLQLFIPGIEKVPQMLRELQRAVALKPNSGYMHFMLAEGYFGSGDDSDVNSDKIIIESKRAIELNSRLTESYALIAAAFSRKKDWKMDKLYLDKYVRAEPEAAKRPDILATYKIIQQKLSNSRG